MLDALTGGPLRAPVDHPAAGPFNLFHGTVPEVTAFEVDGQGAVVMQPGRTVTVTWWVWNAGEIRIYRQTDGPVSSWPLIHQSSMASGTIGYTASSADASDQRLALRASNACGTVQRAVVLHLRVPSVVTVAGVGGGAVEQYRLGGSINVFELGI